MSQAYDCVKVDCDGSVHGVEGRPRPPSSKRCKQQQQYHGLCVLLGSRASMQTMVDLPWYSSNYATASSRSLSTAWAVEIARGTAYSPPPATLIHAHDQDTIQIKTLKNLSNALILFNQIKHIDGPR